MEHEPVEATSGRPEKGVWYQDGRSAGVGGGELREDRGQEGLWRGLPAGRPAAQKDKQAAQSQRGWEVLEGPSLGAGGTLGISVGFPPRHPHAPRRPPECLLWGWNCSPLVPKAPEPHRGWFQQSSAGSHYEAIWGSPTPCLPSKPRPWGPDEAGVQSRRSDVTGPAGPSPPLAPQPP